MFLITYLCGFYIGILVYFLLRSTSDRGDGGRTVVKRSTVTATPLLVVIIIISMAPGDVGALIFGVKTKEQPSGPPAVLFMFWEDGSNFTRVGTITRDGHEIDVDGLAISPEYGLVGFELPFSYEYSRLIAIDPETAEARVIGEKLDNRQIRGAAFDAHGNLWALDASNSTLFNIDPVNSTVIGTPVHLKLDGDPYTISTSCDLAVRQDGTFIVSDLNKLFILDTETGTLTLLHEDPGIEPHSSAPSAYAGLALATDPFAQAVIFTYEFNGLDDIYSFTCTFDRTLLFEDILSNFNAGRGDLASLTEFDFDCATAIGSFASQFGRTNCDSESPCGSDFDCDMDVDGKDLRE